MAWEDPSYGRTCFHTYSDLLAAAETLAKTLSAGVLPGSPVAIYGSSCPAVLAAILALMSLRGVTGGVACWPVRDDLEEERVWQCGVVMVLVEESLLEVLMLLEITL